MTMERVTIFRLAERLGMSVGVLLQTLSRAELISWGLLAQWDHDQKQLAEFRKAQAFSG